jgi:hypothetical protein
VVLDIIHTKKKKDEGGGFPTMKLNKSKGGLLLYIIFWLMYSQKRT